MEPDANQESEDSELMTHRLLVCTLDGHLYAFDLAPVVEWFKEKRHGHKAKQSDDVKEEEKQSG